MSAAQVRPMSSTPAAGSIRASASLAAHLGMLQHTIPLRARYENFIGGQWVAPVKGGYFDNVSPTTGQVICRIARSQAEDVELRHRCGARGGADSWGRTAVAERARILESRRGSHRAVSAVSRCGGDVRQRQADSRDESGRSAARGRSLSLFRELHARAGRLARASSTTTRWPITTMSRWGWWGRSFRGIFRS